MKCRKCGFANPPGLIYCGNCGTRLAAAPDMPVSPTLTMGQPIVSLGRGSLLADRFEILEEIGSGGMGTVYRVQDKKINEDVAPKLLRPEVAADKSIIARFKNELKIARRITHKNVCRMHDIHEDAGTIFITMEYVPGEDLKSLMRRAGRLSIDKALAVAKKKDERYQGADELLAGLNRIEEGISGKTPIPAEKEAAKLTASERECIRSTVVLPFKNMSPQGENQEILKKIAR